MIHLRNEIDKAYVARVKGVANKDNSAPWPVDLRLMARNQASCLWNPQSGSSY